jgi:ferritin-like metal-binding protein YciE
MTVSSWFSKILGHEMTLDNLQDLLVAQLADLRSAEDQLIEALPQMIEAAYTPELRTELREHLEESRRQRIRLDRVFQILGILPQTERCEAMAGLIDEAQQVIATRGDREVKDAALIAAAQRIEHYEIAGYGCARSFAHRLAHDHVVALLQETLNEESRADKTLTRIAEAYVNQVAARA